MKQVVENESGCLDSFSLIADVKPLYTLFLPNAFLPSSNGENSSFGAVGVPFGLRSYELTIYDRWGNRVFESDNFEKRWDGKDQKGRELANGSYVVKVKLIDARGKTEQLFGSALLIK